MKIRVPLVAGLILVSSVGLAFAEESPLSLSLNLGKVLGSEASCGLTYDQPAIERFIEQNVPASAHDFTRNLETASSAAEFEFKDLSTSQKTARCALVKRSAKDYGFLK